MPPTRIGHIGDTKSAFWQVARFLSRHPAYRNVSFAKVLVLQEAIGRGDYCCLNDGQTIQAVETWQEINIEKLGRTYPDYVVESSDTTDGVFISSLVAFDRPSLKLMAAHLNKTFRDKDVYWDRHQGQLGHRPKNATLSPQSLES